MTDHEQKQVVQLISEGKSMKEIVRIMEERKGSRNFNVEHLFGALFRKPKA